MAATDRLITTLAAEVVGYSRLIEADQKSALEQLETHRDRFVYPKIAAHSGRIARATGDNLLIEFDSPTDAVRCAVELQSGMIDRNIRVLPDRRITFCVGVAIGQVTGRGDDLVLRAIAALSRETLATLIKPGAEVCEQRGELALRLAASAEPAGICISGAVRDAIRDQLPYTFEHIGKQNLEIRAAPVDCYAMNADAVASSARRAAQSSQRRPMRLRSAAIAMGALGTVGACGIALLAWLGTHSSTALTHSPVTADSHVPAVGDTADGAAPASPPQSSLVTGMVANTDAQAPPTPQTPLVTGIVADSATKAPSASQPAPSEIGAVVVRGKQALSGLQTIDNNGTAALEGTQAPSVLQTTANSGAAVVRGNQAPSAPEVARDGATSVIRGTRTISQAPPTPPPDQR